MHVETIDRRRMSESDLRGIAELLNCVFTNRSLEVRMARLIADWPNYQGPESMYPRSLVVRDGDRIVAHAAALPRTIGTSEGEMTVLALVHVGTHPDARGKKFGQVVVRAAFDLVDHGPYEHCLFQTSHQNRPFYEKLGATPVTNRIVNSQADDPNANPFWDEVVMRYPMAKHWPEGDIDLLGPGF